MDGNPSAKKQMENVLDYLIGVDTGLQPEQLSEDERNDNQKRQLAKQSIREYV